MPKDFAKGDQELKKAKQVDIGSQFEEFLQVRNQKPNNQ